jgi:adenylate kinase
MDYNLIDSQPKEAGKCDMCGGELVTREDDTEEALEVRLEQWHQEAEGVLEIFRRKEYVFTIDARPGPDDIQTQIRKCLGLTPFEPEEKGNRDA